MATLKELTTALTSAEIRDRIYQALAAFGVRTAGWKPGATARTIIAGVSIILAAFSRLQADIAKSGFLELAEGDWLEIVARNVYGVEKNKGSFASGNVSLTNAGGGVFTVGVGETVVTNTTTGKTYANVEAYTLAALETNKIVAVQAVESGSASTASAGDIDAFETTMLGVSVTNPTALVGLDAETDPVLRGRCRAKIGTLSPNGPKDAYFFVAVTAETSEGVPCGVTRVTTVADGAGGVTVYVASASGPLVGTSGDLTTPFGAVESAVHLLVEPLGINATVTNATALVVAASYFVYVKNLTLSAAELETVIEAKLAEALAVIPIGGARTTAIGLGNVYTDLIESVISEETKKVASFINLNMSIPAADVPVAANEAPVLGVVTPNVVVVTV